MADNELKLYKIPLPEEPVTAQSVKDTVSSMQRFQTGQQVMMDGIMRSQNFVTGSAGWQIDAEGNAEFNDGTFRGALTASTIDIGGSDASSFHVDIDGNMWLGAATLGAAPFSVTNAGVLTATSGTFSGTITATAGTIGGFSVGTDYIRDAANSFGLASTVTGGDDVRFWSGDTFANRATAPFRITEAGVLVGTSVTVTGTIQATGGYVGSTTALVYESTGINCGTTGHMRGGQTDYETGTGWFIGYAGGAYKLSIGVGGSNTANMHWDGTNLYVNGSTISNNDIYGDGSDGDVTISADTSLARDMYYNNLTVDSTKILTGSSFRIFVKNTLTNNGFIRNNGGAGGTGGAASGGTAGTKVSSQFLGESKSGGTGGTPGAAGTASSNSIGGSGGNGGLGNGGVPQAGGAGGTATALAAIAGGYRHGITALELRSINGSSTIVLFQGGAGGGGGGDDTTTGAGGGGGGGGGGLMVVAARIIVNSGTISCNGGNGGDAYQSAGNAGGGGGGGGGGLVMIYNSLTAGTETANGGTGGAKRGTGVAGSNGSAGLVLKLQV